MKNIKNTKSVLGKETQKIKELEERIEELALTIDKVEDEKLQIVNNLKRALADYQNLEANTQRRLNLLDLQSRKSLAEKLIPVVDDMSMAIRTKGEIVFDEKSLSWVNGILEIFSNLEKGLEGIGLKKFIPEKGSKFDPSIHEALSVIDGENPGTIYEVIQPGYILDDTVIRPSRVVVIKSNK